MEFRIDFNVKSFLDRLDNEIKNKAKSQFQKWVLITIQQDLKELLVSSKFPTYRIQVNNSPRVTPNMTSFHNKMKALLPWANYVINSSSSDFHKHFQHFTQSVFVQINNKLKLYGKFTETEKTALNYFSRKPVILKKTYKKNQKTAEEIIDPIIAFPDPDPFYKEPTTIPSPKNDWIPRGDVSLLNKDTGLFPAPDPNYRPPKELPKPVESWD